MQKRILVFSGLIGFILMGAATAGSDPGQDPKPPWKNVKVLSKNLDEDDMERVMHGFNAQLGVTCIYCHTPDTVNGRKMANFHSDNVPAKIRAREMMKMTFRLNKKYFSTSLNSLMTVKPAIWCGTCHAGLTVPVKNVLSRGH